MRLFVGIFGDLIGVGVICALFGATYFSAFPKFVLGVLGVPSTVGSFMPGFATLTAY